MFQDGFDPLETMDSVEARYYQCESRHKVVSTQESIDELKQWQEGTVGVITISGENWVLPKHGM